MVVLPRAQNGIATSAGEPSPPTISTRPHNHVIAKLPQSLRLALDPLPSRLISPDNALQSYILTAYNRSVIVPICRGRWCTTKPVPERRRSRISSTHSPRKPGEVFSLYQSIGSGWDTAALFYCQTCPREDLGTSSRMVRERISVLLWGCRGAALCHSPCGAEEIAEAEGGRHCAGGTTVCRYPEEVRR